MAKNIKVQVDKRIELMGVCLRLSNYRNKFPFLVKDLKNYHYLDEVNEYFKEFSSHKAIQTLNEIIKTLGFSYDAPFAIILYMDDDWNFHGQNCYPFVDRLKKSPLVLKFMEELKDFVKDTKFEDFFEQHKNYYEDEIKNFYESMPVDDILPYIKNFFHKDFNENEFHVVLALLSTGAGFGRNDYTLKKFYCIESKRQKNGEASKNWGINTAFGRSHYLHEFCHPIVNPESDKNLYKVEKPDMPKEEYERLCASAYPSFYSIVNEYIIRSIQLCYIQDCKEDVQDFFAVNEKIGFNKKVLINLANRLNKFKNSRLNFEDEYVDIANTIAKSYSEISKGKNYGE